MTEFEPVGDEGGSHRWMIYTGLCFTALALLVLAMLYMSDAFAAAPGGCGGGG